MTRWSLGRRAAGAARLVRAAGLAGVLAVGSIGIASADHGQPHLTLEPDTRGCNGVLPSTDGNTDMRFVGGTMQPGGTAVFEISYPLDPSDVGKQFQITDCAFINDVAALRYTVDFVPSNQNYVLVMTLAIPADAPVGGEYCNYAKTTRSPTASQGSQRKAGPSCFIIQAPGGPAPAGAPSTPGSPPAPGSPPGSPPSAPAPGGGGPPLLPNAAVADHSALTWLGAALLGIAALALAAMRLRGRVVRARR